MNESSANIVESAPSMKDHKAESEPHLPQKYWSWILIGFGVFLIIFVVGIFPIVRFFSPEINQALRRPYPIDLDITAPWNTLLVNTMTQYSNEATAISLIFNEGRNVLIMKNAFNNNGIWWADLDKMQTKEIKFEEIKLSPMPDALISIGSQAIVRFSDDGKNYDDGSKEIVFLINQDGSFKRLKHYSIPVYVVGQEKQANIRLAAFIKDNGIKKLHRIQFKTRVTEDNHNPTKPGELDLGYEIKTVAYYNDEYFLEVSKLLDEPKEIIDSTYINDFLFNDSEIDYLGYKILINRSPFKYYAGTTSNENILSLQIVKNKQVLLDSTFEGIYYYLIQGGKESY